MVAKLPPSSAATANLPKIKIGGAAVQSAGRIRRAARRRLTRGEAHKEHERDNNMSRHWVLASLLDSLAAAPAPPTDPVKSEFPNRNRQRRQAKAPAESGPLLGTADFYLA